MSKSWKVRSAWICGLAVLGLFLSAGPTPVQARPKYLITFAKTYPPLLDQAKKVKCMICHTDKKDKTKHNNYGDALKEVIGEKDVKDTEKIKQALEKTEKKDSAVKGKTFGDLIKEGKLPASTK